MKDMWTIETTPNSIAMRPMTSKEVLLTQLNIPALLITQADDVQLWDIAPEREEINEEER